MAEVYRGVLAGERGIQKPVAIKRLRADLRADPRAVELFVNEASIAVRLAHPNVVQGLEFARDDDGYYLVCEWLDCVTLADLREQHGPLDWPLVAHVGRALCDALAHVHGLTDADGTDLEVVHRDVTPDNVFVTSAGRVKLGDFGVATCRSNPGAIDVREVGTPGFSAPEQAEGAWDARSDVYGVGATLTALAGELPEAMAEVLERAHRPDPADRFANARELGRALAAAAAASDGNRVVDDDSLREIVEELELEPCAPTLQLDGAVQSILGGAGVFDEGPMPTPLTPAPRAPRVRPRFIVGVGAFALLALALALYAMREPPVSVEAAAPLGAVAAHNPVGAPVEPVTPTPEVVVAPDPDPDPDPPPRPKPPPTVSINLNAVPWAKVLIDGREVGNTPLRNISVSVGKRSVTLVHPPDKTQRSFAIVVGDHVGQSFIFDLRRGSVDKRTLPQ